ncbi:hypothetical protein [Fibrobacter sp. UWEL]|uniref:hypothetical protein n=1 Tax=Fibrobacter sp. UWEL TaxID=1896209 RepID=UPI00092197E4|nr:hypothetical protein [Fibrobacter sp. UWEL]SHL30124.1 hypothetical protein SAMN05720468_12121 [Fibrobacter sp. UWEL]
MNITDHAADQMKKRGFTAEMLGKLVKGRYWLKLSPQRKDRYLITGFVDGKWWTVVTEKDLYTMVTVRRAHASEIEGD